MAEEAVCDVLLRSEQLHYLARYAQGEPSPCSPFFNVPEPETLAQPALDDLMQRGLLGPEGVEGRLLWTLELVKGAPAYGAVAVRGDDLQTELACFFSGTYSAALLNAADGLRLVSPLPARGLLSLIDDAVGTGTRRHAGLDLTLSATESRVLAAVLDLVRRATLREMLDAPGEPLAEPALAAWLGRAEWPAQWLTPHLGALLDGRGLPLDGSSVPGAVTDLLDRGPLVRSGAELALGSGVSDLVRPFALLDRVVELRAGRVEDGAPVSVAQVVLVRALSTALLLWEVDAGGSVRWLTPTAAEAGELAARLLSNGQALAEGGVAGAAPAVPPGARR